MLLNTENGLSRPPLAVNPEYAAKIPPEHLGVPIVILYVGLNEGLISLCEDEPKPHYVVADGNHRLLAARRLRIPLNAYVLSPTESEVYAREINS